MPEKTVNFCDRHIVKWLKIDKDWGEACSICNSCEELRQSFQDKASSTQDPDPNLLRLLSTNEPPSDEESSNFRLGLTDELKRLGDIDAQIRGLLLQRRVIRHQANQYEIILHPIRRIPAEVLCNIFLFCINEGSEVVGDWENSLALSGPTSTLWAIPRVSRTWRAVALSFPRLWSNIRIPDTTLSMTNVDSHQIADSPYLLSVQLERSASYPLSVSIQCYSRVKNLALLQLLGATSGRWKKFRAYLSLSSYKILSTYIASFSLLAGAYVDVRREYHDDDENGEVLVNIIRGSAFSEMFKSCPNLDTIQVHPRYLPVMEVPFSNIETFIDRADFSDTADCIAALRLLPHLRVFETMHYDGEEPEVVEPFELVCLQRLAVHTYGDPIRLLEFLITPSLRNLTLIDFDGNKSILAFLHLQSECKIQSLELDNGDLSDMDCIQILERMPALETLTLRCPRVFTDRFVERLTADEGLVFVPLLKTLEFEGYMEEPLPEVDCLKEVRPGLVLISRYWI